MEKRIETERLLLRPLTAEDASDVFEWVGDPIVNRFMPYSLYTNVEDVKKWISAIDPKDNEFAFVLKSSGKVVGSGSIRHVESTGAYEFGYNLNRKYWGNGYATEAARAMIGWAWTELGARDFTATHADDNTASGKVIRKCGLTVDHHGTYSKFDGSAVFQATCLKAHFEEKPVFL